MNNLNDSPKSRIYTGAFLLIAGVLVLAHKLGTPIPHWVFSTGTLLIGIGLLIGLKSKFKHAGAFLLLIVGGFFLLDEFIPNMNIQDYTLPIVLISIGALFILRPKGAYRRPNRAMRYSRFGNMGDSFVNSTNTATNEMVEYIDAVSVFGGLKKNILSKNFKGGEITCFMGGVEINLTQADIQGTVVLDVSIVFGGAKLVVPAHWHVQNEVTAVFGSVEDKRLVSATALDAGKTLVLKGTCVFGGIEIKSY